MGRTFSFTRLQLKSLQENTKNKKTLSNFEMNSILAIVLSIGALSFAHAAAAQKDIPGNYLITNK